MICGGRALLAVLAVLWLRDDSSLSLVFSMCCPAPGCECGGELVELHHTRKATRQGSQILMENLVLQSTYVIPAAG
jgi:hypothetical protein